MFYSFKGFTPVVHESAFVHPLAAVTGNVTIGKHVYIGPGAAIRADWGGIVIGEGCNVQESCTIHMFPGVIVILEENVHLGHGAIIHGAHIKRDCMIGMNTVVMDHVVIEEECIVGAMSFICEGSIIPRRSLVVGNPHRIIKAVTDEMLNWKIKGTQLYQTLPADMKVHWKECEPLQEAPAHPPIQEVLYENWKTISGK